MNESTKLEEYRRRRDDFARYLNGHGIDIGCGPDKLKIPNGEVDGWDLQDGDARKMDGVPLNHYDFVYSSHCLEHLSDPIIALNRWIEILKPNGILYVVVPDFVLYEGGTWPSRFNPDHKFAFTLWELPCVVGTPLLGMLDIALQLGRKANLLELRLEDMEYNYQFTGMIDQTIDDAVAQICYIARKR
jgi:SAM-dependent methyltransferase